MRSPPHTYISHTACPPDQAHTHFTHCLSTRSGPHTFHTPHQIALFVAPVLVFSSMFMGHSQPLDLHFTVMEMITVILAVGVLSMVSQDGETHWMEGVLLLGVYVIMALTFYHLPAVPH